MLRCIQTKCKGEINGLVVKGSVKDFSSSKEANTLIFESLEQAFDNLYEDIIKFPQIGNFIKEANYLNAIQYLDKEGKMQPITNALTWQENN